MITYIKGEITHKTPTYIVVETGGVGYHVNISLHTYSQIEKLDRVKILTHLHIKEDSYTLFGFADAEERQFFVYLISVSGIGPSTAQLLLSSMNPDEIRAAIVGEDVEAFRRVKGIGPKTAKQIILDLKDRVMKEGGELAVPLAPQNNTMREEALSALVALGFNRIHVQRALNRIIRLDSDNPTVEGLIKAALKELS